MDLDSPCSEQMGPEREDRSCMRLDESSIGPVGGSGERRGEIFF